MVVIQFAVSWIDGSGCVLRIVSQALVFYKKYLSLRGCPEINHLYLFRDDEAVGPSKPDQVIVFLELLKMRLWRAVS